MRQSLPILVLLAILGIVGLYAIRPGRVSLHNSRPTAAQLAHYALLSALGCYEVDNGSYPKSLQDLLQQPSGTNSWHGPYLEKIPVDPWGHKYIYEYPGKHTTNGYDLLSAGPDGKAGTGDDIGNWMN